MMRFIDDDAGYLAWLAANPAGYVLKCERSPRLGGARLHRASFPTIQGRPRNGGPWTTSWQKRAAGTVAEFDAWAVAELGAPAARFPRCGP
jgi:hypothetical protein